MAVNAFVFGKFLPFHKGHEALIRFARTHCDQLTVLICCSDKETIPGSVRKGWIETTLRPDKHTGVQVFDYAEANLPNTSVASEAVSRVWAAIFKQLVPDCSLLVTSEGYGPMVAGFMGINHVVFDRARVLVPVSATAIRLNRLAHWQFLPDTVKPYFALKVVVGGTESTGKTTLAQQLARHFSGRYVAEAGRKLIANSNAFGIDDLHRVVDAHAAQISNMATGDSPLLFIDTDVHTTLSYARFFFNHDLPVSDAVYTANKADLYLYLANDVAHVQDGTRLPENQRNLLDRSHRQTLADHGISIVELNGSWPQRFGTAVAAVTKLIDSVHLSPIPHDTHLADGRADAGPVD